jgi:hypothetical protein
MRGELVPQDPNDEPASALLKRTSTEKKLIRKAKSSVAKPMCLSQIITTKQHITKMFFRKNLSIFSTNRK